MNRMSREGNVRCFSMFPDDVNFLNPSCPIYRRASTSMVDSNLNCQDGNVVCTTSIATEICAASMFNENAKEFQDSIVNEVRVLLKQHEENEDTICFMSTRVASNM